MDDDLSLAPALQAVIEGRSLERDTRPARHPLRRRHSRDLAGALSPRSRATSGGENRRHLRTRRRRAALPHSTLWNGGISAARRGHLDGLRSWGPPALVRLLGQSTARFCGRRVPILYAASYPFTCWECGRLSYARQSRNPRDQNRSRSQKIRMRLGGSPACLTRFRKSHQACIGGAATAYAR
jgi:hypothetical protein